MARTTQADRERSQLCRHPGCERRWFTTFSPIGPVCLQHLRPAPEPLPTVPTTPPAKSWSDPERDNE